MNDIQSIQGNSPYGPVQQFSPAEKTAAPEQKTSQQQPEKAPVAAENSMPSYTVHYQVQGKQISFSVFDQEGRLVKTVPASEMLHALRRDNLSPRVNLHG